MQYTVYVAGTLAAKVVYENKNKVLIVSFQYQKNVIFLFSYIMPGINIDDFGMYISG